jgi:predicted nucleic acid-binding protein
VILVDSSVWIDCFRGSATAGAEKLDALLLDEPVLVGDLILAEVLQGFVKDSEFTQASKALALLESVELGGRDIAVQAAKNHRKLRAQGITVRKTIDTLIATWCIAHDCRLLHNDRDFDAFEAKLGLRCV